MPPKIDDLPFPNPFAREDLARLGLSDVQARFVQQRFTRLWVARSELEASLAVVSSTGDGGILIEIPRYPDQGAALLRDFYSDLATELGDSLAEQFRASEGQRVEVENSFIGERSQELLATTEPDGLLKVVHSTKTLDGAGNTLMISTLRPEDYYYFGALDRYFPQK